MDDSHASTENVVEIGQRVSEDLLRDASEFVSHRAGPVLEWAAESGPEALRGLTSSLAQALRGLADSLESAVDQGLDAVKAAGERQSASDQTADE